MDPALLLVLVYLLVFFFEMKGLLADENLDPITKLTWTIVLIFVPVLGILLLYIVAPRGKIAKVRLSHTPEDNLKGTPWENDPSHTR